MARGKKKESALTPEEKLAQALVPEEEQPYGVPENWCWVKLAQLCSIPITDGTHKTPTYSDRENGSPFVSAKDITSEYIDWTNIKYITKELHTELYERLAPQKNDVLLAKNGTTGVAALVEDDRVFDLYVTIAVLRPNMGIIIPQYLLRVINSPVSKNQFDEHLTGIGVPNLHLRDIKATAIPLPPFSEQQRIVDRIESLFAKLDEAKEKAQSVLDSFETRKAAILHKAFTGELTAKWRAEHGVEMDSWKNQTLGDVIKVSSGKGLTAKNMVSDGLIPVYGGNGVTGYHNESNVEPDTVVIGRVGFYCGSVHYISEPAWVTDNALIVSYKQEINKWYLVHLLRYADLRQNDSSTAQPVVSGSKIYPISIKIAPIDEQAEIVRILDSLFSKEQQAKEAAEAVLEKIDLLKKSILARAFRGELGTNDPTEESALELLKAVLN